MSITKIEMNKIYQAKYLRLNMFNVNERYYLYGIIAVLSISVVIFSVTFIINNQKQHSTVKYIYKPCPDGWVGFGKICYYFSNNSRNWSDSNIFCNNKGGQLTKVDNNTEFNFLKRYKGQFDHWIGLYRESENSPWRWIDNTYYNNFTNVDGVEHYGYINNNNINTARIYTNRRYICSIVNIT
ncbi:C-type lectin-like type-II membrane protein [Yokapox virus]|uniref:C-type lectin-like type-II membrane protein n=1 Tax=Yokapox virus TaxID=1076255 RepID=G3EI81_9POXV|nr:C-type lectin-like type-II membrane protein [Yokapox virus]AEN03592.1 C-type lectin-like type-II membrane protein [Yokapox virus]